MSASYPSQMADPAASNAEDRSTGGWSLLGSAWLWGGALAWGLYRLLPYTGAYQPLLERYLCGHPLEYVQTVLFCVGIAILTGKGLRFRWESQAAALPLPVTPGSPGESHPREAASAIQHGLGQLPPRLRRTWFAERLAEIADYLRYRPTAAGLEGYAQRLSETAAERHHDSYSQFQTIIWAIPILGFLGTVMGITLAIANVTPEQLDTSLNTVTDGLAVAFDTTAVALTQSIVIVFAALFIRRAESQLLQVVDDRVFKGLVSPLAGAAQQASPIVEAETRAARELLVRTEALIEQQTGLWRESVEGLRERWSQTLDTQQRELAQSLAGGVQTTLGDHAGLLHQLRGEFLATYERISDEVRRQWSETLALHAAQQAESRAVWETAWGSVREELRAEREARHQESARLLDGFAEHVHAVTLQFERAAAQVETQMAAIARQTEVLTQVVGEEQQLAGLQQRLADNLEAVRAADTLQETLHSLNAAIHLLTARARPKAA